MAMLDFLFGKKQEAPAAVPFGPQPQPANGANLIFAPASAPMPVQFSAPGSTVNTARAAPPQPAGIRAAVPETVWKTEVARARDFNNASSRMAEYRKTKDTLRPLIAAKNLDEADTVDEMAELVINAGRRTASKQHWSEKGMEQMGIPGVLQRPLSLGSQAGEGVQSAAFDLPGRIGESLGLENNRLQRVTGQQQLGIYRSFLEKYAPERLLEFEDAISQEGYSKGAEITGRTLETVAESVAVGSAVYRATSAIPAMQRLEAGGRWGRFLHTALQNVAADVGVRAEQAYKNKQSVDDIARGVASSPSMLFAFHSVPALGVGVLADLYAGHLNGLSVGDNLLNAAMNIGGNSLDMRAMREAKLGDVSLDDLEAAFKKRFKGPEQLADATWEQTRLVYNYAQANPGDIKGVQKMYLDGEKRLLKMKADLEKPRVEGEARPIKFTGLEKPAAGAVPEPEGESLAGLSGKGEPQLGKMSLSDYEGMVAREKADVAGGMDPTAALAAERAAFIDGPGGAQAGAGAPSPDGSAPSDLPGVPARPRTARELAREAIRSAPGTARGADVEKMLVPQDSNGIVNRQDPLAPATSATAKTSTQAREQSELQSAWTQRLTGEPTVRPTEAGSRGALEGDDTPRTPYAQRVTPIDKAASPQAVLRKLGMGDLYTELRTGKNNARLEYEGLQQKIRNWQQAVPTTEGNVRIARFLDGQTGPETLLPTERSIAEEIRPLLDDYGKKLGLRPGAGFLQDYFPRIWDKTSMRAELPEEVAIRIAESENPAGSTYNPFTQKRHGMEDYKLDTWAALDAYFRRATRSINMDPVLGKIRAKSDELMDVSQRRYVTNFIERVNFRPTANDIEADNLMKRVFGERFGPRPTRKITGAIRRAISRGAFWFNPMTYLRNLTQGVNTYSELGEVWTLQGYGTFAKKLATGDFAELHREGILEGGVVQDLPNSTFQKFTDKADSAGFAGMRATEVANRAPAYFGAKAKRLHELKGKGVTGPAAEREAIEYAKDVVEKTQFRFDELGVPTGMSSDLVKTALQFQPYTVKQTEFLGRKVKGALKGDTAEMLGLARYAIGSWGLVMTVGQALGLDWKSFLPGARILEEGKYVPPVLQPLFAMFGPAVNAPDKYGNVSDEKNPLLRIAKDRDVQKAMRVFIPGGVQANKLIEAETMRREGGKLSSTGKTMLYPAPEDDDLIDWIRAYAFGPSATKGARAYYDEKPEPKGKVDEVKARVKAIKQKALMKAKAKVKRAQ